MIDDDPIFIKIAADLLELDGYVVTPFHHPKTALKNIGNDPPDLIVLDVRLPEMNGFDVCRALKSDPKTNGIPILIVSAKDDEADVVAGLEMGADDYLSKPLRKREFLARIRAVLRRFDAGHGETRLRCGPLEVDFGSYTAFIHKKRLDLTPKEFELLGFFLKRKGRVVSRPTISENVWGTPFTGSTRTIDVHVDTLRRKLGELGRCITGLKGVGYRFELED